LSKFYRLTRNKVEKALFSITIVTHYRPRSIICENAILNEKYCNAIIKLFRIKLTKHLKHVFRMFVANIKKF